jgi:hypothetical protein
LLTSGSVGISQDTRKLAQTPHINIKIKSMILHNRQRWKSFAQAHPPSTLPFGFGFAAF